MTNTEQFAERYDRLWADAEQFVDAYFAWLRTELGDRDGRLTFDPQVLDFKTFSYAVSCLRRIQDGRRLAITALPVQAGLEPPKHDESRNNDVARLLTQGISDVLEGLPETNADSPSPSDALPE